MALIYRGRRVDAADGSADADLAATLAKLVRDHLGLSEDCAVSVGETGCGHAACGGAETRVVVARSSGGGALAVRLGKPMRRVTPDDIAAAFALSAFGRRR